MAIHIIGESKPTGEAKAQLLPTPDADLPPATSAPAAKPTLDDEKLRSFLKHDSALVRSYAIEQIAQRDSKDFGSLLAEAVKDSDEIVAIEAMAALDRLKFSAAADAIAERFKTAQGDLAAAAAGALGTLGPERLLDAVKNRGRMDDEAYAATATALAIIGSPEVIEFLSAALNRAGALSAERRSSLYGAALLSGNVEIAGRVIAQAITDSKQEEPEQASFPTRAAIGALAGLPIQYSRQEAGLELYDHARELLEQEVLPIMSAESRPALEEALKQKRVGRALLALAPVLDMKESRAGAPGPGEATDLQSIPRRRRGLLQALVVRDKEIGELDLKAGAVFLAAAAQAAGIIGSSEADEAHSPALIALAKLYEGTKTPADLAALGTVELTSLFKETPSFQLRRLMVILTRERFRRVQTLEQMMEAAVLAGHGVPLLDASAEVEDPAVPGTLAKILGKTGAAGEQVLVEILTNPAAEAKSVELALHAASEVRTERIALAIGRRFFELRKVSRGALARAVMRLGDPRLLPLIESRAYPDEPEEAAWLMLSLVAGKPIEGKLEEALDRTLSGRTSHELYRAVRLPLTCTSCGESLNYEFERALIDVDAKDQWGDPAFVGDTRCKACGADDRFAATDEAIHTLTTHMLQFLEATRARRATQAPLVSPAQTEVLGQRMGIAKALRTLTEEIERSPSAIRPRLHRARLRLMLKRMGVEEDLAQVEKLDPASPETKAIRATIAMRGDDRKRAVQACLDAYAAISGPSPRLYDVPDVASLQEIVGDYLAALEAAGEPMPQGIELSAARQRFRERQREMQEMADELRARQEAHAGHGHDHDDDHDHDHGEPGEEGASPERDAAMRYAGRNDPCPCGSGKKFKKCHGKA